MGNKQSTEMSTYGELERKLEDSNTPPMFLPLGFLKAITRDFSSVLGEGGFGVVYKGVLRSGKIIAVKKLFEIKLKDEMFQNEATYLMGIKHKNVVQLVGYCAESRWEAMEQPGGNGKHIMAEIPKRLLCFEYVPNKTLNDHISDALLVLEWNTRYEIIKGVCNGLHFLHDVCHIVHLDLKPDNILMDFTMTPKIADFGLSRIFGEQQSRDVVDNRAGTRGYMAPEYLIQGVVSNKADIFSLGVILIEIITGCKEYPYFHNDSPHSTATYLLLFIEKVVESWREIFECTPKYKPLAIYTQQVRQCITMALKCVDPSMEKRPTTKDIVQMLNSVGQHHLGVHPLELCFPTEPNKLIPCSVYLKNNEDKHVMYKIMEKTINEMSFLEMPIYGIVPPRTTYTLVVTMDQKENLPKEGEVDLLMQTVIIDKYIPFNSASKYEQYIEKAKKLENGVHNLTLKATYTPGAETTCESVQQANPPITEMISVHKMRDELISFDLKCTKPWILMGHYNGYIEIWNYVTQKWMVAVHVDEYSIFCCVKFIEQKQWFIAGSTDGFIYVYSYKTVFDNKTEVKKIMSFRAGEAHGFVGNTDKPELFVMSLTVHPTKPYVLSSCYMCIKLWDWDKNWECIQTYEEQVNFTSFLTFNPNDTNCFVGASSDSTVKIWNLDSLKPKYTLSGHHSGVYCLDFFTRSDQQYLITGSADKTAKIWDMQTKACIYTLEGFMSGVRSVFSHPSVPVLITGTKEGNIHLWSATNFRLQRIISLGVSGYGRCWDGQCTLSSNRVVVGCRPGLWIVEINDEELDAVQGSNESSV